MPVAACSATREFASDDPYANCIDLGDLSLQSASRADAQQQMIARVAELGGDTLLFGERGRTGRLAAVPGEIVERRNRLLVETPAQETVLAVATEDPEEEAGAATGTAAEERRPGRAVVEQIEESPGELWYYGAALRCALPE